MKENHFARDVTREANFVCNDQHRPPLLREVGHDRKDLTNKLGIQS
ncbi:hypothetical protein X772_33700 [Mesorhizobium sp. LSJC280B00]|nr:hypothetical protein X772_33700 [Mesorhizobium sp. LSJC280B00]